MDRSDSSATSSGASRGGNDALKSAPDNIQSPPPETRDRKARQINEIERACRDGDIAALASLAANRDGFVDDGLRKKAWPILIGSNDTSDTGADWRALPVHHEEEQVEKDVNRAFIYYPSNESEEQVNLRKSQLSDLIVQVLRQHPQLSYFQGYHDIVQVFLLVLGPSLAAPAIPRVSLLRIRDFMLPALSPATRQLHLIPAILYAEDPKFCEHLTPTQPFYALSATLTLYAHDIQEYSDIARLFDFLLANEAVVSVYLYAAIILHRKGELLEIPPDDPDMQLFQLSKLPQPLDLELLIEQTRYLYENHPPDSLPFRAWSRIPRSSVLKTTRDPIALSKQTLREGETLFNTQAAELRRQEMFEKYQKRLRQQFARHRRPTILTVAALAIGIVAWWIGRSPQPLSARFMSSPILKAVFGDALHLGRAWQRVIEG